MIGRSILSVGSIAQSGARRLLSTSGARLQQQHDNPAAEGDFDNMFDQQQQHDDFDQQGDGQQAYQQQPPPYGQQQPYGQRQYGGPQDAPARRFVNRGINRVELLGGVAGDPVIKNTAGGSEFASFNLYTNVDRKLPKGDTITTTEVHNVVVFGGMARYVQNNVLRGTRIYLTGRLHYTGGQMAADGSRIPRLCSVNAENIYPLAKAGGRGGAGGDRFGGGAGGDRFGGPGGGGGGGGFGAGGGPNFAGGGAGGNY